jgi:hypothetical protein
MEKGPCSCSHIVPRNEAAEAEEGRGEERPAVRRNVCLHNALLRARLMGETLERNREELAICSKKLSVDGAIRDGPNEGEEALHNRAKRPSHALRHLEQALVFVVKILFCAVGYGSVSE